jgi:hypothetical protein
MFARRDRPINPSQEIDAAFDTADPQIDVAQQDRSV